MPIKGVAFGKGEFENGVWGAFHFLEKMYVCKTR